MHDELTIDMAVPEPKPIRFTFGEDRDDLRLLIKTDFSINEIKRIQWLGNLWSQYLNTPDNKLRESDHRNFKKSMTELLRLVTADEPDMDLFNSLGESHQLRVINKVYELLGKLIGSGDDDEDEEGVGASPNGLDWGQESELLQAPMAAPSAIG